MKYLKTGTLILFVTDCYAYRYDYGKGKIVLRIKCPGNNTTFSDIQTFFSNISDYEYYDGEDGAETLKNIYEQYGADLDIHYKKPADSIQADGSVVSEDAYYDIEVLRDPSLDASIRVLQKENSALKAKVADLQEINAALTKNASDLETDVTNTQIALADLYENIIAMGGEK